MNHFENAAIHVLAPGHHAFKLRASLALGSLDAPAWHAFHDEVSDIGFEALDEGADRSQGCESATMLCVLHGDTCTIDEIQTVDDENMLHDIFTFARVPSGITMVVG